MFPVRSQLRGSAGFAPASHLTAGHDELAEPQPHHSDKEMDESLIVFDEKRSREPALPLWVLIARLNGAQFT